MKVKLKEDRRPLRSQIAKVGPKIDCLEQIKTFQACAALVFNDLPKKIRETIFLDSFKKETKIYLLDRATAINLN